MRTSSVPGMTALSLLSAVVFGWGMLPPLAEAVSPAPDGGYPGGNTAEGQNALLTLSTGAYNAAIGFGSLQSNAVGSLNSAVGAGTLLNNTGDQNTATGAAALFHNTTGAFNTANGAFALLSNTTGSPNSGFGWGAMRSNTMGSYNTGIGYAALYSNTTGNLNTATGDGALYTNTNGSDNTAIGTDALYSNGVGDDNTAVGFQALLSNTGSFNTASGAGTLFNNTGGSWNTADGNGALYHNTTGNYNTAIGFKALFSLTSGTFNIGIGENAGLNLMSGGNNIYIGNAVTAVDGESNTIRIGSDMTATYVSGISGQTAAGGAAVFVGPDGKLGTSTSSKRFKEDIQPMAKASEALFALKPVTFHYKKELDPAGISQFGLIAEEVEKVNRDLVVRDKDGKAYTVRYDQINAMLLNEFLKEHQAFVEEKRQVMEQGQTIAQLQKQIAALTGVVQKMNVRLQLRKAPLRRVAEKQ